MTTHPVLDLLLSSGKLTETGLSRAQRLCEQTGDRLDVALTRLGIISEADLTSAYAECLRLPTVSARELPDTPVMEERFGLPFLRQARAIPIADSAEGFVLAMADPTDNEVAEAVSYAIKRPVRRVVALASDIERGLDRLYGSVGASVDNISVANEAADDSDAEKLRDLASEAPIIRLVNRWITTAVEAGASDIHIEPGDEVLWVRWRVDGILVDTDSQPMGLHAAVVSRIKIMARLDIGERRMPQDGRIGIPVRGQDVDIRVSALPTVRGESIVLRILDRSGVVLDFDTLGFDGEALERFKSVLNRPNGIVLVTGPTGSGKTTTLYTALLMLRRPEIKILTVEDPVEYRFDRITQTQVHPQIGLDFAQFLRSFLRHDPNVMMVGEIRDLEAARAAMQLALTGRLVLSTLHTNDSASAVTRLIDMGVEDYLITATINGIVAQRLVRQLCPQCREQYEPSPEVIARLQLQDIAGEAAPILYRARGCDACNGRGFRGRCGIYEVLILSEPLRQMVMRGASASEVRSAAITAGMESMYVNGARKALAGVTTIEEVVSVTWAH